MSDRDRSYTLRRPLYRTEWGLLLTRVHRGWTKAWWRSLQARSLWPWATQDDPHA